jgi:hypothetical protein
MLLRKSVSSIVAHPNIISSSGKNKCWSNRWSIIDPLHHVCLKSMLKQNRLFSGVSLCLSWSKSSINSRYSKNISIFCDNLMLACLEPIFIADLLHGFISIRISSKLSIVSSFFEVFHVIMMLLELTLMVRID